MVETNTDLQQLKKAIAAHGLWKTKLKATLESGRKDDIDVAAATRDDVCEFGKWLHRTGQHNKSPHYSQVRDLHRQFHAQVGKVLQAAKAGTAPTESLIGRGSAFVELSSKLTLEMMAWQREIK